MNITKIIEKQIERILSEDRREDLQYDVESRKTSTGPKTIISTSVGGELAAELNALAKSFNEAKVIIKREQEKEKAAKEEITKKTDSLFSEADRLETVCVRTGQMIIDVSHVEGRSSFRGVEFLKEAEEKILPHISQELRELWEIIKQTHSGTGEAYDVVKATISPMKEELDQSNDNDFWMRLQQLSAKTDKVEDYLDYVESVLF